MDIYKQELLDHYKHPRNCGSLEHADIQTVEINPSCGDSVQLFVQLDNNVITKMTFIGKGCVISQASSSMFTEYCVGKTIEAINALTSADMLAMLGMQLGPTRLKCCLLPLIALQKGLQEYRKS